MVPRDVPDPTDPARVEPPPCRPPLELIEGGGRWVLEAYNRGHRDGETYATYDAQMDAMRAGKRRMDRDRHPCLLRWESDTSVGTIYWNPDFERLAVRYDGLTETWVVIPTEGHVPFYTTDRQELAAKYGREVQEAYDFKHLELYTPDGELHRTIDHRFVRNELDRSGVRFKREAITGDPTADPLGEDEPEAETAETVRATTPASALAAAVPDLTDIEVELSEGTIHRYRAGWTDGEEALIAVLDPEKSGDSDVVDAFLEAVEHWKEMSDVDQAATVYDDGIGPSPWVAYAAGEGGLLDHLHELNLHGKVRIVDDVAAAYETATLYDVPLAGASPDNVRLVTARGRWRGRLADWGLTRAVAEAEGERLVTHYTAPEQLDGGRTAQTPVYQLGALTYWLVTEQPPYAGARDLAAAIADGGPDTSAIPNRIRDVVDRAMATDPAERFPRVSAVREALDDAL
jgi:hypothetical protein